ncbi:MAG: SDR family NAD(P)-dependent oxidoreductase [Acidobacteriota bacterium]
MADSNKPKNMDIAIVGMATHFPGASNLEQFWENLTKGVESIRTYSDADLRSFGVGEDLLRDFNYVKAGAPLPDVDAFDAAFFGINPHDAAIMDPQHRLFLECAWEALEDAGHTPEELGEWTGVFAGCGANMYLVHNVFPTRDLLKQEGSFALRHTGNDKDLLATRVSYQLNLRGPSLSVQTACSSSLVAVHLACQSLLNFESDLVLAGAVSIEIPHGLGYLHREGEVLSRDGKCRAFDAAASGTVFGSGAGIVVLRRLSDAIAAGDRIYAVIKGSAVNNDGARKAGYLAPSVDGQSSVILTALANAGVDPASVDYLEAHGTGTRIGDPIELAAVGQVFGGRRDPLLLGAVKTNIGHLDTASGIAGLIKTALALESGQIPPTLNFSQPNPLIDFRQDRFRVVTHLTGWPTSDHPRRAGVTSLGIGGTNAHVVLEEPPGRAVSAPSRRPFSLLTLSAKTATALDAATERLTSHLRRHPELPAYDVAYTLHTGRSSFQYRRAVLRDTPKAAAETAEERYSIVSGEARKDHSVAFLFPGQGSQYVGMARQLYDSEPEFRRWIDTCAISALGSLGLDLRTILYPAPQEEESARSRIVETWYAQPILFIVEYALARLWMSWGVQPAALLGHSIGEYAAACLAGVFSLESALRLVCARGVLMRGVERGSMLAIRQPEDQIREWLTSGLSIAAVNSQNQCVVAGRTALIQAAHKELQANDVYARVLRTSHAFHSEMMDSIQEPFLKEVESVELHPPKVPILSNVSGTWLTAEDATDPNYWVRQLRQTVRFDTSLEILTSTPDLVLLEVGPGALLTSLAQERMNGAGSARTAATLSQHSDRCDDSKSLYMALGKLWTMGFPIDWQKFHEGENCGRVSLPSYPFERKRFWLGPRDGLDLSVPGLSNLDGFFYTQAWKSSLAEPVPMSEGPWLVLAGSHSLGDSLYRELVHGGATATLVRAGNNYQQSTAGEFTINPGSSNDWEALFADLKSRGLPRKIVCLWSLEEAASPAEALDQSFFHLLSLAQALGDLDLRVDVGVISSGLVSVQGERIRNPERATLIGPCRVAPQEYPHLRWTHIDIDQPLAATAAPAMIHELSAQQIEPSVAYRLGERWIEALEACQLQPVTNRVRKHGVYLITGGLGGLGLAVAVWLCRTYQARLVLVGRTAGLNGSDREQAALETLRRDGGEILVCAADVTDTKAMADVMARARKQFCTFDGIFHAAGVLDDGLIETKTRSTAERVLRPKIEGTRVLNELLQNSPSGFLVLFSSVSAVSPPAGQVDYCAANAFLNAFAQSQDARDKVIAIGWGPWEQVGMTARDTAARPAQRVAIHPLVEVVDLEDNSKLICSGLLDADTQWVLKEHRFQHGPSLLPATASLDLAVSAARHKLPGHSTFRLENLAFPEPCIVPAGNPVTFQLSLNRQDGAFRFSLSSSDATHSVGLIRVLPEPQDVQSKIDLSSIVDRCPIEMEAPRNLRQEEHFEFGPRWGCLRRLNLGTRECLAFLELAPEHQQEAQQYHLHPALLDVATGAALYLIPGHNQPGDMFLPLSYDRATVYGQLGGRVYSHARLLQDSSSEIERFDITIAGEDGIVLLEVEGFSVKRIGRQHAKSVGDSQTRALTPALSPAKTRSLRLSVEEGIRSLGQIMAARANPVVLVSPVPLRYSGSSSQIEPSSLFSPSENSERDLTELWQRALGLDSVGLDDDFFDLGGHSLIALRLFTDIRHRFGIDLGLATIFKARTIRTLAKLLFKASLRSPSSADLGCVVPIRTTGSKTPVFLVHSVGGNVVGYEELVRCLNANRPVYGLQSKGLDGSAPHISIEEMATHYIRQMKEVQANAPYTICGQSFGGLVAYEVGRQLEDAGDEVGFVGLIDTFQKRIPNVNDLPSLLGRIRSYLSRMRFHGRKLVFGPNRMKHLSAQLGTRRRKLGGALYRRRVRQWEQSGQELPANLRDVDQANRMAARRYNPGNFRGAVMLFRCQTRSAGEDPDYWMGWKTLVLGTLSAIDIPGDHLSMLNAPNVEVLADKLDRCLEKYTDRAMVVGSPTSR